MCNNYSHLVVKCLLEVSIGRDRGKEFSNRECPDHIGAVGTYEGVNTAVSGPLTSDTVTASLGQVKVGLTANQSRETHKLTSGIGRIESQQFEREGEMRYYVW